jgi:hypothetical protein
MRSLLSALLVLIVSPAIAQSLSGGGGAPDMSSYVTVDQVQSQIATQAPALAPVQAVNSKTGMVSVPHSLPPAEHEPCDPYHEPRHRLLDVPERHLQLFHPAVMLDGHLHHDKRLCVRPADEHGSRHNGSDIHVHGSCERADDLAWGSVALGRPACELHGHDDLHGSARMTITLDRYETIVVRPMMIGLFKREFLDGAEGMTDEQVEAALEQWLADEFAET